MKLFSRQKIVLCISPQQMIAGVWSNKKLRQYKQFAHDEIGVREFEAFLQQHTQSVVYLICNINEEDYQRQLLPHSTGLTQKTLLAKKLSQTYRGLNFSVAIQQGREQSASKKDIVLFAAIRHEPCLQPWLEILQKSGNAIAGIYLLPMLSEQLLRSGMITPQQTEHLLLCERLSSGFHHSYWRHTYFHHGRLYTSRLLNHTPNSQNERSNVHHSEIEKSRMYLISQRLLDADTTLHVTLLDDNTEHSYFEKLAKQLRLPLPALIEIPELAHMQLLINGAHPPNLAPPTLTQKFRERRTALQLSTVTLSVLLLCAAVSIYFLQQGIRLVTEAKYLRTQLTHAQQEFSKLQKQSHTLTPKAIHIKNVVAASNIITALPASPLRMMQVLSASFAKMADAASAIRLQSLDWSLNTAETVTAPSHETAIINLATSSEASLQSFITHLGQHPQVASAEILSSAESSLQSSTQETMHGSTASDENAAVAKQGFQLSVTLKPQADGWSE